MSPHPPLTPQSVRDAHQRIEKYIHRTPILTSETLSALASTPQNGTQLLGTPWEGCQPAHPRMNLFFKAENFQRVGAFKARGAFHSLSRLSREQLKHGVITNSSGNHAQALALAAKTFGVPAFIIMPRISLQAKIEATKEYGANVIFSGSTSQEREETMNKVMQETGATFVPPYDHPNTILGQGTMGIEAMDQIDEILQLKEAKVGYAQGSVTKTYEEKQELNAIIAPCGGGGMLSGLAIAAAETNIKIFGAEPCFQGANDAEIGLKQGRRIDRVETLTIADGLRTPLGKITWSVISDPSKVHGMYSVSEDQIRAAMKLVLERMKIMIEPSAAVSLAVVVFNESFRKLVEEQSRGKAWNVCVILSGGNTSVEAIAALFQSSTG
ncbi:MAG: hypothetical protein M1814_005363 [Vezdaea aestivalis]|nr:MAG: hypothetical protein M1814_005363 [Vezdaea aestivalis]